MLLGTTGKFVVAHRFYEKHGFCEIPKHDLPSSFPPMAVDTKVNIELHQGGGKSGRSAELAYWRTCGAPNAEALVGLIRDRTRPRSVTTTRALAVIGIVTWSGRFRQFRSRPTRTSPFTGSIVNDL